jgi:riboflavin kinase/FMN adenylyltransferase
MIQRISSLADWSANRPSRVVYTVGNFDGVHLGHKRLLEVLLLLAAECQAVPVVVTFTGHPQIVLGQGAAPGLLTEPDERARLIFEAGVHRLVEPVFSDVIATMEPQEFLEALAGEGAVGFVVGDDFRFGAARRGGVEDVAGFLERAGNGRLAIVPGMEMDGQRLSSTRIRKALAAGDVEAAALSLGREYSIRGLRQAGDQIGSAIGFPTVNLTGYLTILPSNGVYLGTMIHQGISYQAMIYIGSRPTVSGKSLRLECHVINAQPDVPCGDRVTLTFASKLRDESHFTDKQALALQLAKDRCLALKRFDVSQ